MRIRKCAARLLGASPAGLSSSPPPPEPRAWNSEASSSAASGVFCELNRSPWDDLMCLELLACDDQDEEEEDGGIIGNGVEPEAEGARGISRNKIKFEGAAAISPTAKCGTSMKLLDKKIEESERKETTAAATMKKKNKKKKQKDKKEEAVRETSASCKKTDGKGWHCKRPAQHLHSLCSYHLAQLRSYGHGKSESVKEVDSRKKSVGGAAVDSDFYYYYSGFGPWRGKTRGGCGDVKVDPGRHRVVADEEEDDADEVYRTRKSPVAGEDEEDDESDYNDNSTADGGGDGKWKSGEGDHKATIYKKRGRKKMKARSLKSLL